VPLLRRPFTERELVECVRKTARFARARSQP